ncbi:MAG TPA: alkaline phosphatase family protein [Candidatus Limnocylindrales bacterium]
MPVRSKLTRLLAATALVAAVVVPVASASAHSSQSGANAAVKRIFVIMLENHSQSTVIGNPNTPFINSLAANYGEATSYYGVTHPSQPNYVAAITGQLDPAHMNDIATNHFNYQNLVDQLESHKKTWAAYMDAMPSAGYTGAVGPNGVALYTNKHNPFVLMDDVLSSPKRLSNIKPYTAMAADLNSSHAPDFVWISPDQCNDMHGGVYVSVAGHPETPCPYNDTVDDPNDVALKVKADAFVHTAVDTIRNSKAWTGNSVIFVLSDEADFDGAAADTDLWADVSGCCDSPGYGSAPALPVGYILVDNGTHVWNDGQFGGGKVPAIVIARNGSGPIKDDTPYNHYSLLRTIEQVWGLGYLGYAADAANVSSMTNLLQH